MNSSLLHVLSHWNPWNHSLDNSKSIRILTWDDNIIGVDELQQQWLLHYITLISLKIMTDCFVSVAPIYDKNKCDSYMVSQEFVFIWNGLDP